MYEGIVFDEASVHVSEKTVDIFFLQISVDPGV